MKRSYSLFAAAAIAGVCAGEMSPGRFSHDMPESTNEKPTNPAYAEMAADFRERNGGSIVCADLLGLRGRTQEGPVPSARTEEFYKKRPCPEIIRNAAVIVAEKMKEAAR